MIICYSRCLYCGRRTPHEVCHEHHAHSPEPIGDEEFEDTMDRMWKENFDMEPETCDDKACAQWE